MRSREQKEKGFYEVLDWVEKNRPQYIHQFWRCVFEDHILQLYPTLRILRNSLLDGQWFSLSATLLRIYVLYIYVTLSVKTQGKVIFFVIYCFLHKNHPSYGK